MSSSNAVVCSKVLRNETCTNADCQLSHIAIHCDVCRIMLSSSAQMRAHLAGKKHKNRLAGTLAIVFCPICHRNMQRSAWESHASSFRHARRAKELGMESMQIQPEEAEADVAGMKLCAICDIHVMDSLWNAHQKSSTHTKRDRFAQYISLHEEAERDKNGVSITGDLDFGIVGPPLSGMARNVRIAADYPSDKLHLVSATLTSSHGQSRYSSIFSASAVGLVTTLRRPRLQITITASTVHRGRFEDRIEFLLEDTVLNKQFLITRTLQVIVGNQQDYEALRPTAPYVSRKRVNRKPETDVVDGIPPDPLRAIPYLRNLPSAAIPSFLRGILDSKAPTSDMIRQLKRSQLPASFNVDTYVKHFTSQLWIEEFRMERDLERYDMFNVALAPHNKFHYLQVPGLAEKRPSVLVGDIILAQPAGSPNGAKWYSGHVHVVRREEVGLVFHASFKQLAASKFDVRFKLNRTPMRRQHEALNTAFTQGRVLFPSDAHALSGKYASQHLRSRLRNRLLASNDAQLQAVASVVGQSPGSFPFVIFGPPGTGKTVTMVEAILQVLAQNPSARILACAPSNSAADLIASRLITLSRTELFRAYGPSRGKDQVPDDLQNYICLNSGGHFSVPQMSKMMAFRVIVSTCVSASIFSGIGMPRGHFSHIFIDEAGQATEPEAMISIKMMADSKTNIVLSGDPKQLGPIIRSRIAAQFGLETSYIERLMQRGVYDETTGYGRTVVKLVQNFRSHENILSFPNDRFYRGDLIACADPREANAYLHSAHVIKPKFPVVFHSISGKDDREASSPSFFNADEASLVKSIIVKLREDNRVRTSANEIGVIAPYHAQCLKLRQILRPVAEGVKVGSVEEFQGQERKVIIVSTVRSSREFVEYDVRHTLGFVANPRRFNVAVTRAKALLIIVGDPSVLSLDPLWRSFLNYVHQNGGWTGPSPTWDTALPVDERGGYDAAIRQAAELDMNDFTRRMEAMTISANEDDADEEGDANVDRPWQEVE